MRCPFLKESSTRSCRVVPGCKIPSAAISAADDRCSTPDYFACAVARTHLHTDERLAHCPFLEETWVQYCAAAPVVKYVPSSDSLLSRCNTEAHHYCALFLQRARPGAKSAPAPVGSAASPEPAAPRPEVRWDPRTDGDGMPDLPVPERLAYAPNHMWLDVAGDGTCHVGLDAFAGRVLGTVDRVRFLCSTGLRRPAVSLQVQQVDLAMLFPRRIVVTGCNAHLRADPSPLADDPYGAGWLFTGLYVGDLAGSADLITGRRSVEWMHREFERMQSFVHDELQYALPGGSPTAMDGGVFVAGLARHLEREALLRLYDAFLAPTPTGRPS
jgi:glycine cleavage system H lipoate-binding protein